MTFTGLEFDKKQDKLILLTIMFFVLLYFVAKVDIIFSGVSALMFGVLVAGLLY